MEITSIDLDFRVRLGNLRLDVRQEIHARATALFGPPGAGKSSVLKAIAGVKTPDDGFIRVAAITVFDSTLGINVPQGLRPVGYVPQCGAKSFNASVRDSISMGSQIDPAECTHFDKIVDILELVPLLERQVRHLTPGEFRRMQLAQALVTFPKVLLFDEPLVGLDRFRTPFLPYLRRAVYEMNVALIYVSHNEWEIKQLADLVIVLNEGRVTRVESPSELHRTSIPEWQHAVSEMVNSVGTPTKSLFKRIASWGTRSRSS